MARIPRNGFGKALRAFYDWLELGAGTVPAVAGLTVTEEGVGPFKKSVINFSNVALALTDNPGVIAYGGMKIYDFPEGSVWIMGAVANLVLTKSSAGVNADWDGDFGVGTATAGNDAALAAGEQSIIPTTATPQAVAGATTAKGRNSSVLGPLDGSATAIDLYVNFLVDDVDHNVAGTPCNLILNGTITVHWANLGDY
jgi:hypothetical protein